jgi:hypothetical protein
MRVYLALTISVKKVKNRFINVIVILTWLLMLYLGTHLGVLAQSLKFLLLSKVVSIRIWVHLNSRWSLPNVLDSLKLFRRYVSILIFLIMLLPVVLFKFLFLVHLYLIILINVAVTPSLRH